MLKEHEISVNLDDPADIAKGGHSGAQIVFAFNFPVGLSGKK